MGIENDTCLFFFLRGGGLARHLISRCQFAKKLLIIIFIEDIANSEKIVFLQRLVK